MKLVHPLPPPCIPLYSQAKPNISFYYLKRSPHTHAIPPPPAVEAAGLDWVLGVGGGRLGRALGPSRRRRGDGRPGPQRLGCVLPKGRYGSSSRREGGGAGVAGGAGAHPPGHSLLRDDPGSAEGRQDVREGWRAGAGAGGLRCTRFTHSHRPSHPYNVGTEHAAFSERGGEGGAGLQ